MKEIRLSDSTYQRLLSKITSFDDTPETVISRLLDEAGTEQPSPGAPPPGTKTSRAAPGSVLPVRAYWIPILEILDESGGSAPSNDVIDALEDRMKDMLTARDFEHLKSGEIRWRNRARFARLRMKEQGLLNDASHRGIWEISGWGRDYLTRAKKGR